MRCNRAYDVLQNANQEVIELQDAFFILIAHFIAVSLPIRDYDY